MKPEITKERRKCLTHGCWRVPNKEHDFCARCREELDALAEMRKEKTDQQTGSIWTRVKRFVCS
jgi:rRNA maturation endonuclease Nob1